MLERLVELLAQRNRIVSADHANGELEVLIDSHRLVKLRLPPHDLELYVGHLSSEAIPGLQSEPSAERDEKCLKHVRMLIDELLDSDLDGSLRQISLLRNDEGRLVIERIRGTPRRSIVPPGVQGGGWSDAAV